MNARRCYINDDFRISHEEFNTGWDMPYAHYHNSYEIYLLKTGERKVTFGDTEFPVHAREVTLFNSNVMHCSRGNTPFSGICIHFSKWYLEFFFTPNAVDELMQCFNKKIIALNDDDFMKICTLSDNFIYGENSNFAVLCEILTILNKASGSETARKPLIDKGRFAAEKIITYVNENYAYIRTITEISQRFGVTDGYVHKIFRERFDTTPKHYINALRIRNVCHHLKYTKRSTKQLAADSGFESYSYFLRVFKAETGLTPTQYRTQAFS